MYAKTALLKNVEIKKMIPTYIGWNMNFDEPRTDQSFFDQFQGHSQILQIKYFVRNFLFGCILMQYVAHFHVIVSSS